MTFSPTRLLGRFAETATLLAVTASAPLRMALALLDEAISVESIHHARDAAADTRQRTKARELLEGVERAEIGHRSA